MVNPTPEEIARVSKDMDMDEHVLSYAMDDEEGSRIELEQDYEMILVDAPTREMRNGREEFTTYPLSIISTKGIVITVCIQELSALTSLIMSKSKSIGPVNTADHSRFILQILYKIGMNYQSDLRYIENKRLCLEESIRQSTKRDDLFELHELESNLVYFRTSLGFNNSILRKLGNMSYFSEKDEDLLDDVINDCAQALEMTTTYNQIIKGTRQLVESDISNTLANVMKFLTSVTLIISIPTMISSFYGMNVDLPFMDYANMSYLLMALMVLVSILCMWILNRRGLWR